ncbi:hypothetical protein BGZ80_002660 [Entomortierella chlamydospora]|uniref:Uncharacterized protein n=1 Tax=Entomortierella chlamydospora TaxID=101097 RepID=A0A9P6SWZ5_9FUNG|nr:hypothetical protein BGZ80_002660 [Entomortierella chlamydospora]
MAPPSGNINNSNGVNHNGARTNNHSTPATVQTNEGQPSLSFSQAFALGVSIPTSKFNTEAFGSLSVRPVSNTTSGVGTTTTTTGTGTLTGVGANYDPESLDDDFEIPLDLDDEFGMIDMDIEKDVHGLDTGTEMSQMGFVDIHPPVSQNGIERIEESQAVAEAAALKQRVAELEAELNKKNELLQVESGRSSVLKDKLEDVNRSHMELNEKFRLAQVQYQAEKQVMEEKHLKDLNNANMNHQFEVQKYILDGPSSSSKNIRPSQQIRNTQALPSAPVFPKEFSGFASTQSSVKIQPRDDFSVQNFAVPPKSPRKSRTYSSYSPSLEKPRPIQISNEPTRAARPVFGFRSDIPTQSEEEIIRDKLLAGHEHSYGLRQLLTIEADEERISPLPGSQDFKKNLRLEQITEKCVTALSNLILGVNIHSKLEALKTTTALLQASLIMRKPFHTVNSFQVLTTLCHTYEDIAKEICRGTVPFLENEREDPLAVSPSEASLSTALACIYFLFLTRLAIQLPTSAPPAFPSMRKEHSLPKDAEELLEANIFLLLNLVARQHLEAKTMNRTFVPLIRLRIYNKVLIEQRRHETLNRSLELLDLIVRDVECSRLLIGWSISKTTWTEAFPHIDTFVDLIDIKTEKPLDMANGLVPRLKIKVVEILDRITRINSEQTEKIIHQTKLIIRMIHSIRDLVELAGEIHNRRAVGSIWQGKDSSLTNNFGSISSSPVIIAPKVEPFGPGSGEINLADAFSAPPKSFHKRQESPAMQQRATSLSLVSSTSPNGPGLAPLSPPPPSSSPISPPTSLFSSFYENLSEDVHYRPLSLGLAGNEGGMGARRMAAFMSPDNRIFDYMVLLKLELEFILNIIHTVPEYRTYLFNREPSEYRALAFAVSKIVVWDLGLPAQAQELALEVLGILVIHDEEEPYYLGLVKDMNKIG